MKSFRRSTRCSAPASGRPPSGVLEIQAVERVPVVVWRTAEDRAPRPRQRARRRGGQPHTPSRPAAHRRRGGRPRTSPRRWPSSASPSRSAPGSRAGADGRAAVGSRARPRPAGEAAGSGSGRVAAQVMALEAAGQVLKRDVAVVDMRDPARPAATASRQALAVASKAGRRGRMRRQHAQVQRALNPAPFPARSRREQPRCGRARHRHLQDALPRCAAVPCRDRQGDTVR